MASQELPAGLRLGSYELVTRIGAGGMGTVYAAVHVGLGKRVAIKTLRTELADDPDVLARFLREGKAAVAVRHPNVVDVDDVGVHDGVPYLVMELLEGESLHTVLARRERLSVQESADIVVPVLSAMAESHRAGVVHRDLKPDNIFLARGAGGLPVPKVLDFGISKLLETQSFRLTGDKTMLGTPYYMAPEQASSARDVDARSDLYAIGVILYHAVTGRVPFPGSSLEQVLSQILHAQPVPLQERVPELPQAFESIVLRAMAKDPAMRFQDAQSMGRALLAFASERIVLTYQGELADAAVGGQRAAEYGETSALHTTLRSAVRSQAVASARPVYRWLPWLAAAAMLGLVVAALASWPRTERPIETTVQPVQQPPAVVVTPPPVAEALPPAVAPQPADAGQPAASTSAGPEPKPPKLEKPRLKSSDRGVGKRPPASRPEPAPVAPAPTPEVDVWGIRK